MNIARKHLGILDVNRLLEWFLFNPLLGNPDAHAKNISIIHGSQKTYRLAPFYDLVCTRAYERLDRKLAMACGREFDPDLIGKEHLETMAQEVGVTARLVKQKVKQFFDRIPQAKKMAEVDLVQQGFTRIDVQHVEQIQQRIIRGFQRRLF